MKGPYRDSRLHKFVIFVMEFLILSAGIGSVLYLAYLWLDSYH